MSGWRFWIDRGGTFTDIVARTPTGSLLVHKLLSENPERYADAAVHGISTLMAQQNDPDGTISDIRLGTTVATNALLERKGDPTVLAITAGLADVLTIGHQARPRLFDRRIVLPPPLHTHTIEIDERKLANGSVRRELDLDRARRDLQSAYDAGFRSLAIVLMHAYAAPEHEIALEALAREIGYTQISASHRVSGLMKIVDRGATTVADAYLSPPLRRYIGGFRKALAVSAPLSCMQSNGGLATADEFRGRDAILSGPAGGVVGMVKVAAAAGFSKVIGFDMGGTSTDVSHYAGVLERALDTDVAGLRLRTPMMSIHTVAAGGGSICRFDGARLRVGPESAGANPGPASYRRGGPLTITDCNVLLGRLQPDRFPPVFGPAGDLPLDAEIVAEKFEAMARTVAAATGKPMTPQALAEGFVAIAVDNMAHAIKRISIARGHDLSDYALVSFGGAGGQHACLVAEALGMKTVLISPLAGVLSAFGIGQAEHRSLALNAIEKPLQDCAQELPELFDNLERQLADAHRGDGVRRFERRVHLKRAGTDTALAVEGDSPALLRKRFEAAYFKRFAFMEPEAPLVVESIEVELIAAAIDGDSTFFEQFVEHPTHERPARICARGQIASAPVLSRAALGDGRSLTGPALVVDSTGATVIEPGWSGALNARGDLVLTRVEAPQTVNLDSAVADPVRLELFANLFMSIAENMGAELQSTASSVNIKERLDFSCALFDDAGALIANAPHMPVHLGSMGDSVRQVVSAIAARGDTLAPGDVYALNNPYGGGTHLPDITAVMPVFAEDGSAIIAFVAARGHHADIGGITPGSMPPHSTRIEEEGVLLDSVRLVRSGQFEEAAVRALLASGPFPARNINQNIGDLRAQIAACARGAAGLQRASQEHGQAIVQAYMAHVQDYAANAVRRLLGRLRSGEFRYETDQGWTVSVRIDVDQTNQRARIDFTGTDPQLQNNFNAPPSVARAACLYVLRTLLDDEIPMNDGCLAPIDIVNPPGCLLNPSPPAAVVAGNVETSQVVTDALYGAVEALAAAQGTMNNFTFGDDTLQYYETICGGAGAGPGFDGASAVHTHMTNSRLTDPEVIETRFPVLIEHFSIRRGSGGAGRFRGGDGVTRHVRFLRPMTASILSNRRRVAPFGLAGGMSGALGENQIVRAHGAVETLPACAVVAMDAEDVFVIKTPGGGGYGDARQPDKEHT